MFTTEEIRNKLAEAPKAIVELGCGPYKRIKESIGVDLLPLQGVDFVANIEEGLGFLSDNSVDEIHTSHVFEHIQNYEQLMCEVHRVLKPDGIAIITVPYFSNPYYYSDYTHKRFFGLYSFDYMGVENPRYKRKVPAFYVDFKFRVLKRYLGFKSPFYIRNLFKQLQRRLFNFSPYMQELYESSFCYLCPCQEITFTISPAK